jgi:hypothetical protein
MDVIIREFHWSGSNSITVRSRAAQILREELEKTLKQFPNSFQAVIGHSHGGNVALEALRSTQVAPAPSWLLVSLATPFLTIGEKNNSGRLFRYVQYLRGGLLCALGALIFPHLWAYGVRGISLENIAIAVILLLGVEAIAVGFGNFPTTKKYITDKSISMLVLRSIDDEANLALMAGSISAKALSLVLGAFYIIARVATISTGPLLVVFFGVMVFGIMEPEYISYNQFTDVSLMTGLLILGLITLAFVIMAIVLFMIAAARTVSGRELFFGGILREINLQSTPDFDGEIQIKTLKPDLDTSSGFRHSIYQNNECPKVVANWMLQHCGRGDTHSAGDPTHTRVQTH